MPLKHNLGTSIKSRNSAGSGPQTIKFIGEDGTPSTWEFDNYRQAEDYFALHPDFEILEINGLKC